MYTQTHSHSHAYMAETNVKRLLSVGLSKYVYARVLNCCSKQAFGVPFFHAAAQLWLVIVFWRLFATTLSFGHLSRYHRMYIRLCMCVCEMNYGICRAI